MRRRLTVPLLAASAVVAVALLAPAAGLGRGLSNRIVVMRSIAGFTDGLTPRAVERRLGRPSQTIRVGRRISLLEYDRAGLSFGFDTNAPADPVDDVSTTVGRYRTSRGIHVGSSARAMHRAYPGVRCHVGLCDLERGTPGTPGSMDTAFTLLNGRVDSIQIQKVFG